ncbi:MAG: sigma-70 family RNA polymerase sigma factor [Planctomycetes bacterium]|nr:sigma-70 family RNA polymerase sigma factor [Planctomycetota bacterium]
MAKSGDGERFLCLLSGCQGAAEAVCRGILEDPTDLPDVIQTAVLNAFRAFPTFEEGTHFRAWFLRFIWHAAMNANRRHRRFAATELGEDAELPDLVEALSSEDAYAALLRSPDALLERLDDHVRIALRQLAEPERATFLLRSIGDLSYKEIAIALDIPVGSVMGYLHRARAKLRRSLAAFALEFGWVTRDEGGAP